MRLLLISNRLPITVNREQNQLKYESSVGGLVTGICDYLNYIEEQPSKNYNGYLWVGWPGNTIEPKQQQNVQKVLLEKFNSVPVFLPEKQMEKFYHGFCNKTLWPLFHCFPLLVSYDDAFWNSYKSVNEAFCSALVDVIKDDDIVWVHDYHLLLLPALLRKKHPNIKIGFFLHIPFPPFEIFRLLPKIWREKILSGLLGADLIGFHSPEYTQYFLHCVQRIIGIEHNLGKLMLENRIIKADTFPMGINFEKFNNAEALPEVKTEIEKLKSTTDSLKVILSIDRLDYTKGILNRLYGYEKFLINNPDCAKKVVLILIVVPSRIGIEHYQQTKRQVDEYVGKVNGKFGDVNWVPILYQYKFCEFSKLVALYKISDVALVTPLRDGMNLIAKEYVAARKNKTGVLILSEMAGAAKEMGEALVINPNSIEEIADAIKNALFMSEESQIQRNQVMQLRLQNYNIIRWAEDFLQELQRREIEKNKIQSRFVSNMVENQLLQAFKVAKHRILFLDYDGTLAPLVRHPDLAKPSEDCLSLLTQLVAISEVDVVLISGRNKNTLQNWFQIKNINLVAEHGAWIKYAETDWQTLKPLTNNWKPQFIAILQIYVDRVSGSFIEDKDYSICWHYRNADQEYATIHVKELICELVSLTANSDLQIMQGNKVIEIKNSGVNKGTAATTFLAKKSYDFILAIGDDSTDEDLFQVLPTNSFSIKVGFSRSYAKYNLLNCGEVISILKKLINVA